MAHTQRKCARCRRSIQAGARSCPECGSRESGWVARYRGPDGRERSRSFARKVDAERFAHDQEAAKSRGTWIDPGLGRFTVGQLAGSWMRSKTLKPKTASLYAGLLRSRILPTFGDWPVSRVRPSDVQTWVSGMKGEGLSASRIRQAHVVLSALFAAAMRDERIGRNPATGTELPRLPSKEAAYFEPPVVESIAATMGEYALLVRILGTLGLRFGEVAALRRRSVNLLTKRLVVEESLAEVSGRLMFGSTKTHATRRIPLTASLAAALEAHLEQVPRDADALLFTSPEGSPLRYSAFRSRCWHPALTRLGLPAVGVHVLRHSAAAGLIHSGASPKAVQTILGHRSAAFTLTVYGHLFDTDLDDVATALESSLMRDQRGTGFLAAAVGATN